MNRRDAIVLLVGAGYAGQSTSRLNIFNVDEPVDLQWNMARLRNFVVVGPNNERVVIPASEVWAAFKSIPPAGPERSR